MSNGITLTQLFKSCKKTDMKYKLSAGIMVGNHIVPNSVSCNSDRTFIHGELFHSKHAEHGALLYLKNKKVKKNIKLIVIRIDSIGRLVNSTPCENCIYRIRNAGITKIIYVNENNVLIEDKINHIKFQPSDKKGVTRWFNSVKYNRII